MNYYLIAGEASGDLHGAYLMRALQQADPQAAFRCWGGDLMQAAGGDLRKHYRELAFMGFVEVVANLRTIRRNFKVCRADILDYAPDALVLIDYPGFNLRMAKWAHGQGIRVLYYISPQIWAWHSSRVHQIKAFVDKMYVILPFEADFYARYDYPVKYVGHPLLDVIADRPPDADFRSRHGLTDAPLVALLPGSRKQEISRMLSVMLATAHTFPDYQFVVAGAPSQPAAYYTQLFTELGAPPNVRILHDYTYPLLSAADAALVTSGTATLETALLGCPQVVCYRGSSVSYAIARRLVNIRYISLVNLILDAPLVLELIQHDYNPARVADALRHLLTPAEQQRLHDGYTRLRQSLGDGGAAQRCADDMVGYLKSEV